MISASIEAPPLVALHVGWGRVALPDEASMTAGAADLRRARAIAVMQPIPGFGQESVTSSAISEV